MLKNKLLKIKSIINQNTSDDRYKIIVILMIIISAYGVFVLGVGDNVYEAIIVPFSFPIFICLFISLFIVNTIFNTLNYFQLNYSYIIRMENKRKLVNDLLKRNLVMTIFNIIIFIIVFLAFIYLKGYESYQIIPYEYYNISYLLYSLFYILRYFIIITLICLILTLLLVRYQKIIALYISTLIIVFSVINIDININGFYLLHSSYFEQIKYSSFYTEVMYSCLYIIIVSLVIKVLYNITIKDKINMEEL